MRVCPKTTFAITLLMPLGANAQLSDCSSKSAEVKHEAAKTLVQEWGPVIAEGACSEAIAMGVAKMKGGEAGFVVSLGRFAVGVVGCHVVVGKAEAFFKPNLDNTDLCGDQVISRFQHSDIHLTPTRKELIPLLRSPDYYEPNPKYSELLHITEREMNDLLNGKSHTIPADKNRTDPYPFATFVLSIDPSRPTGFGEPLHLKDEYIPPLQRLYDPPADKSPAK